MNPGSGWTDERIALLTKLWRDGFSGSQVARQLGNVTRNAVIAKLHRLGLTGRPTPSKPARTVLRAPRPARPAVVALPPPRGPSSPRQIAAEPACTPAAQELVAPVSPVEPAGLATPLTLGKHACKWPLGEPGEPGFSFCGRPAVGSWCADHAQIVFQPSKPRSAANDLRSLRRYL